MRHLTLSTYPGEGKILTQLQVRLSSAYTHLGFLQVSAALIRNITGFYSLSAVKTTIL